MSIKDAVAKEGITLAAYNRWRAEYPGFNEMVDGAKKRGKITSRGSESQGEMSCAEFRLAVFNRKTEPHQIEWDAEFERDEDHILILAAPEAGKSTYLVDRICYEIWRNPNIRIAYVSRGDRHAKKMVSRIKGIISQNKQFRLLAGYLKPGPGDKHPWRETYFMVNSRSYQAGEDEADYTVASFGTGTQITGSRIDLLIVDDPDDVNVDQNTREKTLDMILQAAETRLGTVGKMVVIGNRQNPDDVYGMILEQERDDPGLWRIFSRPAIAVKGTLEAYPFDRSMDYAEHADKVDIIWPEKYGEQKYKGRCRYDECEHRDPGKGKNWNGRTWARECAWTFFMRKKRRLQHRFDMIYQMVAEGQGIIDFTKEMIDGCKNPEISFGDVPKGAIRFASMDPAATGGAAVMIFALYLTEHGDMKLRIVDFDWGVNKRTQGHLDWVDEFGARYRPRWWGVDKQGPNKLFAESPELEQRARAHRGAILPMSTPAGTHKDEHFDTESKGSDVAISAMVPEFQDEIFELPARSDKDRAKLEDLEQQLLWYTPNTRKPIDLVMCLSYGWRMVKELGLERRLGSGNERVSYLQSPYQQEWGKGAGWTSSGGGWSVSGGRDTISNKEAIAGDKPLVEPEWRPRA